DALRMKQKVFDQTGALHAAALFDSAGRITDVFEDVGRHNAVDKVIGSALEKGLLPLSSHGLLVSGRTSFEVVQKALSAGIGFIASVSAPTSLAVEAARENNQTLAGFLRKGTFNLYTRPSQVK
ncbi:MAG TPA: formate dehydrogenase accessory sulfurtransferase FdhD, partial [Roseimicrobium sp.]|nr:formate dehydrogenase accessory sulfurtransferase FdhD [Roseimicrobium sp.]